MFFTALFALVSNDELTKFFEFNLLPNDSTCALWAQLLTLIRWLVFLKQGEKRTWQRHLNVYLISCEHKLTRSSRDESDFFSTLIERFQSIGSSMQLVSAAFFYTFGSLSQPAIDWKSFLGFSFTWNCFKNQFTLSKQSLVISFNSRLTDIWCRY